MRGDENLIRARNAPGQGSGKGCDQRKDAAGSGRLPSDGWALPGRDEIRSVGHSTSRCDSRHERPQAPALSAAERSRLLHKRIGYRRRSSTKMVAPTAVRPSSKKPKWYPHQNSEPPCGSAVSTNARAEQRSHRSATVRVRAGFLSIEVFISAIPSRPSGNLFDTTTIPRRFDPVDRVNGPLTSGPPTARWGSPRPGASDGRTKIQSRGQVREKGG